MLAYHPEGSGGTSIPSRGGRRDWNGGVLASHPGVGGWDGGVPAYHLGGGGTGILSREWGSTGIPSRGWGYWHLTQGVGEYWHTIQEVGVGGVGILSLQEGYRKYGKLWWNRVMA